MDYETLESTGAIWKWYGKTNMPSSIDPSRLEEALTLAKDAKENAYAPYSKFSVGAAVLMDDSFYTGANVENASYGATMCAERTAIFAAAAAGRRRLNLVAITTSAASESAIESRSPCGMCRQVISEFAHEDTLVLLDAGKREGKMTGELFYFDDLLPYRFRLED